MDLIKNKKRDRYQYPVQVDKNTLDKIKNISHLNKMTNKELIKRAIDLYQKVSIFDNL